MPHTMPCETAVVHVRAVASTIAATVATISTELWHSYPCPCPRQSVIQSCRRNGYSLGSVSHWGAGVWVFSGPETGKRKRVTRKADGELTLLVNLGGTWHGCVWLPSSAYPCLLTHFRATEFLYNLSGQGYGYEYRCLWKSHLFMPAFALQSRSRNCSPAPELLLFKLNVPRVFSRGVFFSKTGYRYFHIPNTITACLSQSQYFHCLFHNHSIVTMFGSHTDHNHSSSAASRWGKSGPRQDGPCRWGCRTRCNHK